MKSTLNKVQAYRGVISGLLLLSFLMFTKVQLALAQVSEPDTVRNTEFEILGHKDRRITIPFEEVNNLIIIKASVNGSVPLKFILDTGVGSTIITSLPGGEEIYLTHTRTVSLSGLGEGEAVEAFYSDANQLRIGDVVGQNLEILFLKEDIFKLSSFMGTNVHGIIGYDLFNNFAVEVNYISNELDLYDPELFNRKFERLAKHRLWHRYPIILQDKKPYIYVKMKHQEEAPLKDLRLLIDSGSSNAFSLYEITDDEIKIPESNINTLIGVGLSGNVNGYLGRIEEMQLGDYTFEEPVIAYPDSHAIRQAFTLGDRNGSLGGEVLRRFKMIFNYQKGYVLMRSNRDYKENFYYNISGIEVNTPIPNIPLYVVSQVREGSPADKEGIMKNDVIKYINGHPTAQMDLNEILSYFQKNKTSRIRLGVERDSKYRTYSFKLENSLVVDE